MATKAGEYLVSNKAWDRYKRQIKGFLDIDAGRQTIIWARHLDQMLSHGEDTQEAYFKISIEGLCFYNAFRNWPMNKDTKTGSLDEENLSILISVDYIQNLEEGKYFVNGYWDFNWQQDRFVINGLVYRPSGDTQVSQAKDEALVFMIILKRDRETILNFIE